MRILLLYDNFVRDYRGLLLLKESLSQLGHKAWIRAGWNSVFEFAKLKNIDVLVTGQIAEWATHRYGKFAKENNIRLVINSSENVTTPNRFNMFVTYNTHELNDWIIDIQSIATKDVYEFTQKHPDINSENKHKYKYIGFPRFDLSVNETLRKTEHKIFRDKYNLDRFKKVYLFVSSFLLEGAHDGVPEQDLIKWGIAEFKKKTSDLLQATASILKSFNKDLVENNAVLLIKKHPWDCSGYFNHNFSSDNCIILDKTDYIVPCISNADFILHTYSTSAIEAWVMEKKTIAILIGEYKKTEILNHMAHEVIVESYDELKAYISNYPELNPSKQALEIFGNNLDGKATWRLAKEIDKLKPHPEKTNFQMDIRDKIKKEINYYLFECGLKKYNPDKLAKKNTKNHDFYEWENERLKVNRIYQSIIRKAVRKMKMENGE